jgi:hypothetical protein
MKVPEGSWRQQPFGDYRLKGRLHAFQSKAFSLASPSTDDDVGTRQRNVILMKSIGRVVSPPVSCQAHTSRSPTRGPSAASLAVDFGYFRPCGIC